MSPRRPPVIGIAGGIGAGKSAVARALEELGCIVSDSDADARAVLDEPEVRSAIAARFGPGVLRTDGAIDRAVLGRIVFADAEARIALEAMTHPLIETRRRQRFAEALADRARPPRALVIDAPLLFEAGLDTECDAVIFVEAPRATRLARVRASRGWGDDDLALREAAQLPLGVKRRRASHVLVNEGDEVALLAAVARLLDEIAPRGVR